MIENQIKQLIIDRLGLDVDISEIRNDQPIFGDSEEKGGFGLDSIDALEIVVALNNTFQVKITDKDLEIFESVDTIAVYLRSNSPLAGLEQS